MKKTFLLLLIFSAITLQFCSTSKKAMAKAVPLTWRFDISPIIAVHCSPCHFPTTGKKLPLDSYEALTKNIDEVLFRVQLPQTDPKFMPFKAKKEPLSDSLIQVIKLWKEQEMPI